MTRAQDRIAALDKISEQERIAALPEINAAVAKAEIDAAVAKVMHEEMAAEEAKHVLIVGIHIAIPARDRYVSVGEVDGSTPVVSLTPEAARALAKALKQAARAS